MWPPAHVGRWGSDHRYDRNIELIRKYRSRASRLDDGGGSGQLAADLLSAESCSIDPSPYAPGRFMSVA